ncbi:GNAT family N-acetyltransferase [Methanolobus mangrovi]|uniref:GNAT family N-acetyltransferase n=1 Tax=Methanolobus mangrovi TaxID=3072977 RepID=A0AA51UGS3_9EURY|nr:GNAT family N-acetyltransferase [Methanolobus mangrovi]WMW21416.1 GNAT family N-acetyltransferase [Methanolobus mangrovi]
MDPIFSINETSEADYLQVRRFIELVDTDFYPPLSERGGGIPERVDAGLDTPKGNFLVARLKERDSSDHTDGIVGMVGYTRNWKSDDSAYINFLATHPQHRNQGISRELCLRLEEFLGEQEIKRIYLCTWSSNPAAIKFYEKLGYYAYSVVLDDRGRGINTIYYKKDISIPMQNNNIRLDSR